MKTPRELKNNTNDRARDLKFFLLKTNNLNFIKYKTKPEVS